MFGRLINYTNSGRKKQVFTPHTFHTWGFQTCAVRVAAGHLFPHWLLVAQLTLVVRPCAAHAALLKKRGGEGVKRIRTINLYNNKWVTKCTYKCFDTVHLIPQIPKKFLSGYLLSGLQKEFHSDNVWTTTGLVRSITADYFTSRLCQTRTGLGANSISSHCRLYELVIPLCIVSIFQMALNKQSVTGDYSLKIQLWGEWLSSAFFIWGAGHNLTSSKPTNGGSADMCLFVSGPDVHGSLAKGIRDLRISCKALW